MKFKHQFKLQEDFTNTRIYSADNSTVRLDFIDHILRVSIIRNNTELLPTYTIRPATTQDPSVGYGLTNVPREGRNKLSLDGFDLIIPTVLEEDNHVKFSIDNVDFDIDLFNFRIKTSIDGRLLFQDREYIAYNFDHELGSGSCHYISREENERIYGMGDKTGSVNKNKRSFKMAASDAMGFDARSSDPLYKQLPFYICQNSVGSYGIYYDTYSNGELNFGQEINNYYAPFKSFTCDEENLVFYIILGSVSEIVTRFSKLMGPILFPPRWTFSYAGSTMSYTDAPDADAQLRGFINLCKKHGINPGGFYLSSGYTQIGNKRYVFHWNTDKIPSPEGLAAFFKENGVEFFPNVKPAFLVNHPLYSEIASHGWFLHYEDGTPAIFPFWDDYGSYLDFTNPEAFDFWRDCIKEQLVDKGYKNIWNDNNEYDIQDKEVYAHGFTTPIKAHLIRPLFSFLMTMASLEAQDQSKRTVSVSRCGIGGLSRIATTWTGDNRTSFDDFRYNHYMAMTMSLSGFFNFGQDIGGFAGPAPDVELFLRWLQYGIFTPRFVLHSWNPDKSSTMPWLYPDVMPSVQLMFALRDALVPYLYNETYKSALSNTPILSPLFLKHPEYDVDSDMFYCGESILAAPVFDQSVAEITVTLPANNGDWYYKEKCYYGQVSLQATMTGLPVFFIKGGSIIPWARSGYDTHSDSLDLIDFTIYPLESGTFTYSYLQDDGDSWLTADNHHILTFTVECTSTTVKVSVTGGSVPSIKLVDIRSRELIIEQNS